MFIFTIVVYVLIGIFAVKFIFWDAPKHSSKYWKSVTTALIVVSVLCGFGYLSYKDENATFWMLLVVMLFIVFMMFSYRKKEYEEDYRGSGEDE